jgi:hypothetical protein
MLCLHYSLQLEYAYLFYARYFLPTRMHNGEPGLRRIGNQGYAFTLEPFMLDVHLDLICVLQHKRATRITGVQLVP